MPKINPFERHRPAPVSATSPEFTDPGQPGDVLQMSLRVLDDAEILDASTLGQHFIDKYIGDEESGTPPLAVFPFIDGRPVQISAPLCYTVAELVYAQTNPNEDDRYTFEQIVALMVTHPVAMKSLMKWFRGIKGGKSPKDLTASTAG